MMACDSNSIVKELLGFYGYESLNYKCLYNILADIIRSNLHHCNSNYIDTDWNYVDIRSVLYHARDQFSSILEVLNSSINSYFLELEEKDASAFILDLLVDYGDITKIKDGRVISTPTYLVKISENIGYAVIGCVPIQNSKISIEGIRYDGVARIIKDIEISSFNLPIISIKDWVRIPSDRVGLDKWLQSLIASLNFNETVLTSDYEVFDVNLFKGLRVNSCWVGIDQYKNNDCRYAVVRKPIKWNRYKYWIVKGSIINRRCMLADFIDIYRNRVMCGVLAVNNKVPIILYENNKNEICIKLNPVLVPKEEMRLIKAFSYPYPKIEKNNNTWILNEDMWDIFKTYMDKLGFEYKEGKIL